MAVCHSGDAGDRDAALAPIRALGEPVVDLLAEQPYTQVQSYLDATEPKGHHYYWRTEYLAELSDDLLATMRELFADCPIPDAQLGLLHLGGALNEHASDDGAVGNRDARFAIGANGMWEPGEPEADAFRALGPRRGRAAAAVLDRRQLHQLPDRRRGRAAHPRDLRRQLRSPRRDQGGLRSGQPVPLEPQRPPAVTQRVLIVGGGIAGLALAGALARDGAAVEVIERDAVPRTAGTGLYLPGNAVRALRALGVEPQGHEIPRQRFCDHRGRLLFEVDVARLWAGVGPCLAMHRADLHALLLEATGDVPVRRGLTVTRIDGPAVELSDGSGGDYDVVVGADGIHSGVRALAFAAARRRRACRRDQPALPRAAAAGGDDVVGDAGARRDVPDACRSTTSGPIATATAPRRRPSPIPPRRCSPARARSTARRSRRSRSTRGCATASC